MAALTVCCGKWQLIPNPEAFHSSMTVSSGFLNQVVPWLSVPWKTDNVDFKAMQGHGLGLEKKLRQLGETGAMMEERELMIKLKTTKCSLVWTFCQW